MSTAPLPGKLALQETSQADRATALNFKQIRDWANAIQAHVATLRNGTSTGTTASGSSDSTSLATIDAQIAAINAALAALQAEFQNPQNYVATASGPAYQAVYQSSPGNVTPADVTAAASAISIVGVTIGPSTVGSTVGVAENGATVTNGSWSWTPGPVFLGLTGNLTQNPLSVGGAVYLAQIGFAISATTIFVAIGEPTFLGVTSTMLLCVQSNGSIGITTGGGGNSAIATNVPTTQALSSGALVNLIQAGTITNARLADASLGIEAHGYVLQAYASGAAATIYDSGPNSSLGGLTPGNDYFLGVGGMVTLTPYDATNPANAGKIIQPVGTSLNTTTLIFSITTVTHL